ncbi:hypothetical protein BP00DRAFT_30384 [Aspergillus indologenus CBS 114.80]|uniref:Uncharacterized protein n=1 Tax=Aspergillus indologenus CBS 114.80 TaxID=1450541 RepID=A0A2V5HX02_9EURO|nr:hypothetical protein BP00DRAFT_30384 [Aspergillus indologenus CBS 114.80]
MEKKVYKPPDHRANPSQSSQQHLSLSPASSNHPSKPHFQAHASTLSTIFKMQPTVLLMGLFAAFAVAAPTAPGGSSTDVTYKANSDNTQDNSQNVDQTQVLPISVAHDGILNNDDIVKNVDVTALNDVANDLTAVSAPPPPNRSANLSAESKNASVLTRPQQAVGVLGSASA